jgi:FtsH-binding integral membrane protein
MTIQDSKLHADPTHEDIPVAEVLPLRDPRGGDGPKAYVIGYKNYHDDEETGGRRGGGAMASLVKEARVLENLGWDPETRRTFIRRVYSILAAQLLWTGFVSAFMILHAPTQAYVLTHGWPVSLSIVLSIVTIVALLCMKDREPHNMYLLGAFTLVEAFLVGSVTTAYCAAGQRGIVLEAVFLTGAIFVGLTVFTFQSKVDFSFLGAALYMGLGALVVWGFFAMIFGVRTGYVYALLACIVFSGYILFDTWLIMDKLSPHEHVLAAIMLYLDIINLFVYLLQLLASRDQR